MVPGRCMWTKKPPAQYPPLSLTIYVMFMGMYSNMFEVAVLVRDGRGMKCHYIIISCIMEI
jgi:hypothetical protein